MQPHVRKWPDSDQHMSQSNVGSLGGSRSADITLDPTRMC
jgi:hypothetical protein